MNPSSPRSRERRTSGPAHDDDEEGPSKHPSLLPAPLSSEVTGLAIPDGDAAPHLARFSGLSSELSPSGLASDSRRLLAVSVLFPWEAALVAHAAAGGAPAARHGCAKGAATAGVSLGELTRDWKRHAQRGLLATALRSGTVRDGDEVRLLAGERERAAMARLASWMTLWLVLQ